MRVGIGPAIFAAHDLTVKVVKSHITGIGIDTLANRPADFTIVPEGFIVLGIPIGSHEYTSNAIRDMVEGMAPPSLALKLLRPRTRFTLVSKCMYFWPSHLFKGILHWTAAGEAPRNFDDRIVAEVGAIFDLPVTPTLKTRIGLTRTHGGLGLKPHNGMISEKGQILSRLIFTKFLTLHYPSEVDYATHIFQGTPIHLGTIEGVEDLTEITAEMEAGMTHTTAKSTLSAGQYKVATKVAGDLHQATLAVSPQLAAWELSKPHSGTGFMDSTVGSLHEKFLRSDDYICAGRARLGAGASNVPPPPFHCGCHQLVDLATNPLHGISCFLNNFKRKWAHTDLLDEVYRLISKRYPNAPKAKEVEVGRTAPDMNGATHAVIADIVVTIHTTRYIIDVTIVDPGCQKSLTSLSHVNQDAAAKRKELTKKAHYRRVVTPARLQEGSIVPFVVEASGRLGPLAMSFLFTICGTQTLLRSKFLNEVNLTCARMNGGCLRSTRDRIAQYPQNVGVAGPMPE